MKLFDKIFRRRPKLNIPLTFRDIFNMDGADRVYIEQKDCDGLTNHDVEWVQSVLRGYTFALPINNLNYARKWRCWKVKPTDADRRAVPWVI